MINSISVFIGVCFQDHCLPKHFSGWSVLISAVEVTECDSAAAAAALNPEMLGVLCENLTTEQEY